MKINLDVIYNDDRWKKLDFLSASKIKKIIKTTLDNFKFFYNIKIIDCCILLTCEEEVRSLNKEFRKIDKDTNVLSFPAQEIDVNILNSESNYDSIELGDIAFSYDVMIDEAEKYDVKLENHFTHLLIHSILHLIGFDHQTDSDEKIMQNYEVKILDKFSISSPY